MKRIEAIIRPGKLDDVTNALAAAGINGITVSNVLGCGNQKGHTQVYRGQLIETKLLPKLKIEIVTQDQKADELINIIVKSARTGAVGDGKIFVFNVEEAIRIRTGETGEQAI